MMKRDLFLKSLYRILENDLNWFLPRDKFILSLKWNRTHVTKENVSAIAFLRRVGTPRPGDDIDFALKGGPHDWRILIARASVLATPKVFPSSSIDVNPENERWPTSRSRVQRDHSPEIAFCKCFWLLSLLLINPLASLRTEARNEKRKKERECSTIEVISNDNNENTPLYVIPTRILIYTRNLTEQVKQVCRVDSWRNARWKDERPS